MKTELRLLREKKGLSLRKLGEETGIHFTRLQRMEARHDRVFPRDVERLCAFYGVEPDAIKDADGMARIAEQDKND